MVLVTLVLAEFLVPAKFLALAEFLILAESLVPAKFLVLAEPLGLSVSRPSNLHCPNRPGLDGGFGGPLPHEVESAPPDRSVVLLAQQVAVRGRVPS